MLKITLHINSLKEFIIILIITMTPWLLVGQDLSKINLAHAADLNAEIRINSVISSSNDKSTIFLNIQVQDKSSFWDDYSLVYQLGGKYTQKAGQETDILESQSSDSPHGILVNFEIPTTGPAQVCILKITNIGTRRDFFFDIPINDEFNFKAPPFYLKYADLDQPVFKTFVNPESNIKISTIDNSADQLYVFKYKFDFDHALPPMQQKKPKSSKSMTIDSTFQIDIDQLFTLKEEGLYFFQQDTTTLEGLSIRVTNKYFPKAAYVDDLIGPMVYLTTRLEYKSLINANNRKKAMDSFWIKIGKTNDRAKRIIRNYFSNVNKSNLLFSHYKPGWKTDKGMIYIVFGPPEEVYKSANQESWIYNKKENMSKIKFTFDKVKNIFSRDHYELRRENAYEKFWYRTIDLWRKGRKGI